MDGCGEVLSSVFWIQWFSSFTLELAAMLSKMSHGVLGVLRTDLAIAKVCLVELGYDETVCNNLTYHHDIEVKWILHSIDNLFILSYQFRGESTHLRCMVES